MDIPAPAAGQPFRSNRTLQLTVAAYLIFWGLMLINPYDWYDWFLENLLIFAAIIGLVGTYRWFRFSDLSYVLIAFFLAEHTLGAHYSYTTTPIDRLMHALFHFPRDDFDRVVHASFGLLIAYPTYEFLRRVGRFQRWWAYGLTVAVILAGGAFYELIEMWVAKLVAPEIGTLFLGTQGDPWDTQQDMAVALYGAAFTMAITALLEGARARRRT